VVYLGFSAYLAAISLQRPLVTDPLVGYSARKPRAEGIDATRKALTVAITAAAGWALLLVVVGRLVPGPDGPGLIAFAPWLIGASLQVGLVFADLAIVALLPRNVLGLVFGHAFEASDVTKLTVDLA